MTYQAYDYITKHLCTCTIAIQIKYSPHGQRSVRGAGRGRGVKHSIRKYILIFMSLPRILQEIMRGQDDIIVLWSNPVLDALANLYMNLIAILYLPAITTHVW